MFLQGRIGRICAAILAGIFASAISASAFNNLSITSFGSSSATPNLSQVSAVGATTTDMLTALRYAVTDGATSTPAYANAAGSSGLQPTSTNVGLSVAGNNRMSWYAGTTTFATGDVLIGTDTTSRVGINVSGANPQYPLDIRGSSAGGAVLGIRPTVVASGEIQAFINPANVIGSGTSLNSTINATNDWLLVQSNGNTVSSTADSTIEARVGGASGGDPGVLFTVSGAQNWKVGIDNSASDALVISRGSALGTNNALSISTTNAITVGTLTGTTITANAGLLGLNVTSSGAVAFSGIGAAGAGESALCRDAANQVHRDATGTCTVSARRFKSSIEPLTDSVDESLSKIMLAQPVSYVLNKTGQLEVGFIADDLLEVDRRVVNFEEEDPSLVHNYDTNGMLAILWNGVRSLILKVTGVEARLDAQQKEIDELHQLLFQK